MDKHGNYFHPPEDDVAYVSKDAWWLAFWALLNAFVILGDASWFLDLLNACMALECLWAFNDECR